MDKKKILICDDEIGIRESFKLILEDFYDLSFCTNGEECLKAQLDKAHFDLVLLDIKMPKISGLDLLKKIKTIKPEQKIIMVSGYKSFETANEAIQSGASDYVVKPFRSQDLLKAIAKQLEQNAA